MILNIAGYHFTSLTDLISLRETLIAMTSALKGTILLSHEGININLAGNVQDILTFKQSFHEQPAFETVSFRESYSHTLPFKRLKIKIKKEIITFRDPTITPCHNKAPSISPTTLKEWLDHQKTITLVDTRNTYEIAYGTFNTALNMQLNDFSEFSQKTALLPRDKPLVLFCTGGIRCEKAGLYLLQHGFKEVYQLEGGILNYFSTVGDAHFSGHCFVFDERTALNSELTSITH